MNSTNLCGELVIHKVFGSGQITDIENNCIMVLFSETNEKKRFIYPSALDSFLQLKNEMIMKEYQDYRDEIVRNKLLAQKELEDKIIQEKVALQIQVRKLRNLAARNKKKDLKVKESQKT